MFTRDIMQNSFKMFSMKYLVLYPVFLLAIQAAEFPPYLSKCCGFDPNFDSCIVANMQKAVIPLLQGDPHYSLPSFIPFRMGKVVVLDNENAYFVHRNSLVHGFSSTRVLSASVDWNTQTCNASYSMKALVGRYSYDLRLNGSSEVHSGKGGNLLENVVMNHSFSFIMQSDGHAHIVDPMLTYSVGKTSYELENDDPVTSQFLNDNFASFHEILKEKVNVLFCDTLTWPFVSLAEAVTLNDMSSCPCEKKRRKCKDETHPGENQSGSCETPADSCENPSDSGENKPNSDEKLSTNFYFVG